MKKQKLITGVISAGLLSLAVLGSQTISAKEDTWSIYIYLCGSDLESDGGAATADLIEMQEAELPENVQLVIQTGGASEWQNEVVDGDYLERYLMDSEDMYLVDQAELANMGEASTFADFLDFCHSNYPADHEGVILWNHGGGSVYGIAFDELYDYDSLTLEEVKEGFSSVYNLSSDNPPLEFVGFDACLMSTIDTAKTLSDIASYMIASEETEPGCGWYYTGWLDAFAENPSMDCEELGKVICDSYLYGCELEDEEDEVTLSVVDLGKIDALLDAYNEAGKEALQHQYEDSSFYAKFSRAANSAENFGGNTDAAGYSNLVDLGDLMSKNEDNLPNYSGNVLNALDECVLYKINGKYKSASSGLSCYYSFNNDEDELKEYLKLHIGETMGSFYEFCMTGEVNEDYQDYLDTQDYSIEDLEEIVTIADVIEEEEDLPVYIDEDGYATLELEEEVVDTLTGVYFDLFYVEEEDDFMLCLGSDNNLDQYWDEGVFYDNFEGYWGAIDGHFCYMELVYEGEDYNTYLVPILLNGEEYQLHVVYDYDYDEYEILGARKGLDDNGMSDRNLVQLEPGDTITTLIYSASAYGDDDFELYEFDEFEVTEDTYFADEDLGDGQYIMMFKIVDCRGNEKWSEPVYFDVEDGEIEASI